MLFRSRYTDERLCEMSVKDYKLRHGIRLASAEISSKNDDGSVNIALKDKNGDTVVTYTIDPETGKGTDSNNENVNLPQTGNNNPLTAAAAAVAVALTVAGAYLTACSVRRKD